jgi:hypothetical protein
MSQIKYGNKASIVLTTIDALFVLICISLVTYTDML